MGQAIVGNVTQGALEEPAETPALTDARQPAMPSFESEKKAWLEYEARKKKSSS
jgi:hypothetical protein